MRHFLTTYRDSILAFTGIIIAIISLGVAIRSPSFINYELPD